jgi:hypothetical protein
MKTALAVVALLSVAACANIRQYAKWPYRGPMMMVRNSTSKALVVMARDGAGRELVTARIKPNAKQCFRWPFIHDIGYLEARAPGDTLTTEPFKPWSADGWEWSGELEPVSNPKVCR